MTDHLKEAYEHERSERAGCRATARRCRGASKDRAVRPSGHASETEWSDRVVIQSLVVGPGSAGRATNSTRRDTHRNSSPSGQCFTLFCQWLVLRRTQIRRGGLLDARFSPLRVSPELPAAPAPGLVRLCWAGVQSPHFGILCRASGTTSSYPEYAVAPAAYSRLS